MKLFRQRDLEKAGIYGIINKINNKIYIGKSINIYNRIKQHIILLNKESLDENRYLINSWKKYGRENFEYIVIEYLEKDENLLKEKELYWIDYYNSTNKEFGYNLRLDTSTNCIVSQDTRNLQSVNRKKRYSENPELRTKVSENTSLFWKNNPDKLAIMAEKVSAKIRKYKIGKFDKINDTLLEVFNTRKELSIKYPDFYTQAILGCCQGTKSSYKGFKWRYISIETNEIIYN